MVTISELYAEAEASDIIVINHVLPQISALSVCEKGKCIVAVDEKKFAMSSQQKVALAHELGHCKTGAFYNQYSKLDEISRSEYRADKWAIQYIIPFDGLVNAVKHGLSESWELADYFGVTEEYIRKAYEIYTAMGMFI